MGNSILRDKWTMLHDGFDELQESSLKCPPSLHQVQLYA